MKTYPLELRLESTPLRGLLTVGPSLNFATEVMVMIRNNGKQAYAWLTRQQVRQLRAWLEHHEQAGAKRKVRR